MILNISPQFAIPANAQDHYPPAVDALQPILNKRRRQNCNGGPSNAGGATGIRFIGIVRLWTSISIFL
jgi:hypothetical protein